MSLKQSSGELFVEKFEELSELYSDVKGKIILAEELYQEFPLTLINEVRNSYDHVFRIFLNQRFENARETQKQFVSASRHLKRAGYDACELIVGGYVVKINTILSRYTFEELNKVLSKEYSDIKIFINDVHSKYLVEARSKKNLGTKIEDDIEIDELYPEFVSIIDKVEKIWKNVVNHEPLLEQYREEEKYKIEEAEKAAREKSKKDTIKQIVIGVLLVLFGAAVTYLTTRNDSKSSDITTSEQITEKEVLGVNSSE